MKINRMADNKKNTENGMNKRTRVLALILALTVVFAVLFSTIFIAVKSHHDCDGEHCEVCYQIEVCENTLKTLSDAILLVSVVAVLTYCFVAWLQAMTIGKRIETLVTLKVKLSN